MKAELIAARALIEKGWCQYSLAKNANGVQVKVASPDACQFCAMGALYRVLQVSDFEYADVQHIVEDYTEHMAVVNNVGSISLFNDMDGRTKKEVLALFDKAIAACQ